MEVTAAAVLCIIATLKPFSGEKVLHACVIIMRFLWELNEWVWNDWDYAFLAGTKQMILHFCISWARIFFGVAIRVQ